MMKISEIIRKTFDTAATIGKVMLKSRIPSGKNTDRGSDQLIIMGNGPSLRQTIDRNFTTLMKYDRMAVNFAANAPEFFTLRPTDYILADPHFFNGKENDGNVWKLWNHLKEVSWPMRLHVPATMRKRMTGIAKLPEEIKILYFNMTPGEGFESIIHPLFGMGLAMPRPRNVMIPAIMEGIRAGYRKIYLTGADHTWTQSLYVDERNRVVSIQPHFYKDDSKELDRVAKEYEGYHLHDILGSMTVAFRSYHETASFAEKKGVEIVNATEGSMIDAFRRGPLSDLR